MKDRQQAGGFFHGGDFSLAHQGDFVAEFLGLLQIMSGQDDGVPGAVQFANKAPERQPQVYVHPGGGLVQNNHGRTVNQGLGYHQPAFHSAGEFAGVCVALVGQMKPAQQLVQPRLIVADAVVRGLKLEGFANGEKGVIGDFLRDNSNSGAGFQRIPRNVKTEDFGGSGVGFHQSAENADEGGFSGAVGSEQPEKSAARDGKRNAVQGGQVAEALADIFNINGGGGGGHRGDFNTGEWKIGHMVSLLVLLPCGRTAAFACYADISGRHTASRNEKKYQNKDWDLSLALQYSSWALSNRSCTFS